MDCAKVGRLISALRREKHLTQKQLAAGLNISDKTISKWERGQGCPDVSLLRELSVLLGTNIEHILSGALDPNDKDGGNMRKLRFHVCPTCGNIVTATGDAGLTCCGRKLEALTPKPVDEAHKLSVEEVEDDWYITFAHDMSKTHFIRFVACVSFDRVLIVRLYPEQGGEVRFPRMRSAKLFLCCSEHGLWAQGLPRP